MEATVFVPVPHSRAEALIDPGSGIVGDTAGQVEGRILVDFEGNRFGAANIATFADRVSHAADRSRNNYPTTARAALPSEDLVAVGVFDPERGIVHLFPDRHQVLAAWLGRDGDAVDEKELLTTDHSSTMRRDLEKMARSTDHNTRMQADWWAKRQRLNIPGLPDYSA